MSKSNLAASIRQRLKNRAKESGESFNLILVRFGLEPVVSNYGNSAKKLIRLQGRCVVLLLDRKTPPTHTRY